MTNEEKIKQMTIDEYQIRAMLYNRALEHASKWFESNGIDCWVPRNYIYYLNHYEVVHIRDVKFWKYLDADHTDCRVELDTIETERTYSTGNYEVSEFDTFDYRTEYGRYPSRATDSIHSDIFLEDDDEKRVKKVINFVKKQLVKEERDKIVDVEKKIEKIKKQNSEHLSKIERIESIEV